jgi:hypothetical protein
LSIISSSLTVRELLDELAGEMGRTLEQEEVHIAYGDQTWTLKAEQSEAELWYYAGRTADELCPARHALSAVSVRRPLAYLSYGPAWFLGDDDNFPPLSPQGINRGAQRNCRLTWSNTSIRWHLVRLPEFSRRQYKN